MLIASIFAITAVLMLVKFLWPAPLPTLVGAAIPQVEFSESGTQRVSLPEHTLMAIAGEYRDELYAFLMFDYLRTRSALSGSEVLLEYAETRGPEPWRILVTCPNDVVECLTRTATFRHSGLAPFPSWEFLPSRSLGQLRQQTAVVAKAYSGPVGDRFKSLSPAQRVQYVRRFLRFKSSTDPRVRGRAPDVQPLTTEEASELAADIIAVADFYQLPLEFMLGIGAMENNYMNVPGDLNHAVWKRRAEPGDIVLQRRRGRVLVKNFSIGVWQITRETLRFAHSLYLADQRSYELLPERLRPERKLDLDHVRPEVLTTYAGLLLRYLLDYFHGDVAKAVGAYNGGVDRPNDKYEQGVRQVAEYARRILERAAAIKDASVQSMAGPAPQTGQ